MCNQLTKSHWGNTQLGQTSNLGHLETKTPASLCAKSLKPVIEVSSSSGYMADSSSARTPGQFLGSSSSSVNTQLKGITRENVGTPHADEKRQKFSESLLKQDSEEEEDFDEFEPTGCINDMINQF